jgi:hypothetical protein
MPSPPASRYPDNSNQHLLALILAALEGGAGGGGEGGTVGGATEATLLNLNASLCTGTWAGGVADNAAVSGTIPAPGAGKAIFFKNLTFSYGAAPPSVRVLTIAEGANNLVDFAITSGGAGFVSLGFAASPNTAATFSLPASGTAGVSGRLRIYYAIVDVI